MKGLRSKTSGSIPAVAFGATVDEGAAEARAGAAGGRAEGFAVAEPARGGGAGEL
ncbi:MAG: hypothetical protein JNL38_29555, partial [Myxococcales bacterium]|nr:hypothetical protein [Myxococcales bacterium]